MTSSASPFGVDTAAVASAQAPYIAGAGPDVGQAATAEASGMTAATSDPSTCTLRHDPTMVVDHADTSSPQAWPAHQAVVGSPAGGQLAPLPFQT